MRKICLILALALALAACGGRKTKPVEPIVPPLEIIDQLVVGKTTMDEAIALFESRPVAQYFDSSITVQTWSYRNIFWRIFRNARNLQEGIVTAVFDGNGILKSYSHGNAWEGAPEKPRPLGSNYSFYWLVAGKTTMDKAIAVFGRPLGRYADGSITALTWPFIGRPDGIGTAVFDAKGILQGYGYGGNSAARLPPRR
jgi:hypothetical protein